MDLYVVEVRPKRCACFDCCWLDALRAYVYAFEFVLRSAASNC